MVTVDGRLLKASPDSNEDLFWALRGGGGNFGVVTELEYRLHPLDHVLAGTLVFPSGKVPELLQAFARFVAVAPDEMNVVGQVVANAAGAHFQMLVCHCGDPAVGNRLLATLRFFNPRTDDVRISSYAEANATVNPAAPSAHFQTNLFLPDLSEAVIATLVAACSDAPPNTRSLHGAVLRRDHAGAAERLPRSRCARVALNWTSWDAGAIRQTGRARCGGSKDCATHCGPGRGGYTSINSARRARNWCGQRTGHTTRGSPRSRKSMTPATCCG